jgi:hypothetical protein
MREILSATKDLLSSARHCVQARGRTSTGIRTEAQRTWPPGVSSQSEVRRERRTSYRVGGTDADGNPCLGWGSRRITDDDEEALVQRDQNQQLDDWYRDNDLMDVDVEDHGDGHPGLIDGRYEVIRNPQDVDDCVFPPRFVESLNATIQHVLPVANPYIAPGYAVTGLPAYLEVGAPVSYDTSISVMGISVRVWGEADYLVEWESSRTVLYERDNGGPYPHGNIRHTYATVANPQTIQVTGMWTVNWSARGQTVSGIPLQVGPVTYELPVEQWQAVRTTTP